MKKLFVLMLAVICMTEACTSEVAVHAIPDSVNPMKMTPALFTEASDSLIAALGVQDGIPSSLCSFLLIKDGKNILIDSGNGREDSQLIPTLAGLGLAPEDIDYVFLTHLHGDHTGGLTNGGAAVFTEAQIYLNKDEYDGWGNVPESDMGKAYGDRIVVFDADDESALPCGIKAVKAYGHTPGHTLYRVGDMLFAGDIMHAVALQRVNPDICARFDQDKEASASTRKAVLQLASEEGLKVYGAHFPEPHYIQF